MCNLDFLRGLEGGGRGEEGRGGGKRGGGGERGELAQF